MTERINGHEASSYLRPARIGNDAWVHHRMDRTVNPECIVGELQPSVPSNGAVATRVEASETVRAEVAGAMNRLVGARELGGIQHVDAVTSLVRVLSSTPGAIAELNRLQGRGQ